MTEGRWADEEGRQQETWRQEEAQDLDTRVQSASAVVEDDVLRPWREHVGHKSRDAAGGKMSLQDVAIVALAIGVLANTVSIVAVFVVIRRRRP